MMPGPISVVIPKGGVTPVKIRSLLSGNTIGATFWTDGKCQGPMLAEYSWLLKYKGENLLFWDGEYVEIDSYPAVLTCNEKLEPWFGLEYAETPEEKDYFRALKLGLGSTREKQKYLRLQLWWAGNDRLRRSPAAKLSKRHIENLEALLPLLKMEKSEDRLIRAEVLRELGRFDEALQALNRPFRNEHALTAERIRALCLAGDRRVAKVQGGGLN